MGTVKCLQCICKPVMFYIMYMLSRVCVQSNNKVEYESVINNNVRHVCVLNHGITFPFQYMGNKQETMNLMIWSKEYLLEGF